MSTGTFADYSKGPPKLPLWQTIGRAYGIVFSNFGSVLRTTALWMILLGPLTAYSIRHAAPWQGEVMRAFLAQQPPPPQPWSVFALNIAVTIIGPFAGASIAVSWHRFVLRQEQPGVGANILTNVFWRYVAAGLLMSLVAASPMLFVGLPAWGILGPGFSSLFGGLPRLPLAPPSGLFMLLWLASGISATILALRLVLILPARAVGQTELTLRYSWHASAGNVWRLFWGSVICMAPPLLLAQLIVLGFLTIAGPYLGSAGKPNFGEVVVGFAIPSAVLTAYYFLTLPIAIGFLSYAYQFLVERKEAELNQDTGWPVPQL